MPTDPTYPLTPPHTWHPLSLTRPCYHLRCLSRGMAPVTDPQRAAALSIPLGTLAPVLSLSQAARLLGLATLSSVQTAERRELGKGLEGTPWEAGKVTLASLLERARAYGLEVEVRVRRKGPIDG